MTDGFLTRWSRRKLEHRDVPAKALPDEEARVSSREAEPAPTDDESMTPEEIAALPAVSDITLNTDITGFLRKGVPVALRNAALQRLWVLDPEIRDFIGEARDYAWDWNTPGGVPVSGPLESGTDIPAMLRRVFGEATEPARENVIARSGPERPSKVPERHTFPETSTSRTAAHPAESGVFSDNGEDTEEEAPIRRHGSALPG